MSVYILPVLLILLIFYALIKKVNVYDCFLDGGREGLKLSYTVFPYLTSIFILIEIFRVSGLSNYITTILSKPLAIFGIPKEVAELLILRPLSGSGSLALLNEIFKEYGPTSYVGKTAAVIMGSSETILYISAIYFSGVKVKKLRGAILISIFATFLGAVVASLLTRLF